MLTNANIRVRLLLVDTEKRPRAYLLTGRPERARPHLFSAHEGRLFSAVRICWFLAVLVILAGSAQPLLATSSLVVSDVDGVSVYYPEEDEEIARRLIRQLPKMIEFLKRRQLLVSTPLHVVLDADLDQPDVRVHMIPHREIRIPLRAPGVFEDGYLEADPWSYFLFRGLCIQGIYSLRSGIPGFLHLGFGEIVSPNIVLPEWLLDGSAHLLYSQYSNRSLEAPLARAIFEHSPLPALDHVSNHPSQWPGHYSYRIYGRPFIAWVNQKYGWDGLHAFFVEHGSGILPIEIDSKARDSLGPSWPGLWQQFKTDAGVREILGGGIAITGAWDEPRIYWNRAGVYPGIERAGARGRFGVVDDEGYLWLSEYDHRGISRLARYKGDQLLILDNEHIWDPGPGGVGVTRRGHSPQLLLYESDTDLSLSGAFELNEAGIRTIPAPPGAIQLSGPVRDAGGRVAVSVNRAGNWDIWLYDGGWQQVTSSPAVDTDPWFRDGTLVFATNAGGYFQIVDSRGRPLSNCGTTALLPRGQTYLCLTDNGWQHRELARLAEMPATGSYPELPEADRDNGSDLVSGAPAADKISSETGPAKRPSRPYTPWESIWPNYVQPEVFIGGSNFQLGVGTRSRDVTGDYRLDGGVRYAFDQEYMSLRMGGSVKSVGGRYTRYPTGYTTALGSGIDESRNEFKLFWQPFFPESSDVSLNYRAYHQRDREAPTQHEFWGGIHFAQIYGRHTVWCDLEVFTDGSQSVFGGGRLLFGKFIYTTLHLQAGKTWGDLKTGHNTYRIGGNVGEGSFTRRPSRLFPLRGFDSNVLDAGQAVTTGAEVFFPLFDFQAGYKTLPLFFHRFLIGAFVDAGAATEQLSGDDILVGGGVELVSQVEVAWGVFSSFSVGIGWPLRQPGYLDETGPQFLIEIGRPL